MQCDPTCNSHGGVVVLKPEIFFSGAILLKVIDGGPNRIKVGQFFIFYFHFEPCLQIKKKTGHVHIIHEKIIGEGCFFINYIARDTGLSENLVQIPSN